MAAHAADPDRQLIAKHVEGGAIRARTGSNDDVRRHEAQRKDLASHDLAKPALEAIPLDDRVPVLRDDDADSWMTQKGSEEPNLEVLGSSSLPFA